MAKNEKRVGTWGKGTMRSLGNLNFQMSRPMNWEDGTACDDATQKRLATFQFTSDTTGPFNLSPRKLALVVQAVRAAAADERGKQTLEWIESFLTRSAEPTVANVTIDDGFPAAK